MQIEHDCRAPPELPSTQGLHDAPRPLSNKASFRAELDRRSLESERSLLTEYTLGHSRQLLPARSIDFDFCAGRKRELELPLVPACRAN
jgi:hypothetical protein